MRGEATTTMCIKHIQCTITHGKRDLEAARSWVLLVPHESICCGDPSCRTNRSGHRVLRPHVWAVFICAHTGLCGLTPAYTTHGVWASVAPTTRVAVSGVLDIMVAGR